MTSPTWTCGTPGSPARPETGYRARRARNPAGLATRPVVCRARAAEVRVRHTSVEGRGAHASVRDAHAGPLAVDRDASDRVGDPKFRRRLRVDDVQFGFRPLRVLQRPSRSHFGSGVPRDVSAAVEWTPRPLHGPARLPSPWRNRE